MDKIRKFFWHGIQTGELKELLIFWLQLSLIVFQVAEQIPQRYFCLFQFSIENSPVEKKNRFHEKNRMLVFCYNYIFQLYDRKKQSFIDLILKNYLFFSDIPICREEFWEVGNYFILKTMAIAVGSLILRPNSEVILNMQK